MNLLFAPYTEDDLRPALARDIPGADAMGPQIGARLPEELPVGPQDVQATDPSAGELAGAHDAQTVAGVADEDLLRPVPVQVTRRDILVPGRIGPEDLAVPVERLQFNIGDPPVEGQEHAPTAAGEGDNT